MALPSATTPMTSKFFFQVEAQSLSEDRVVISDEDAGARRSSVESFHREPFFACKNRAAH